MGFDAEGFGFLRGGQGDLRLLDDVFKLAVYRVSCGDLSLADGDDGAPVRIVSLDAKHRMWKLHFRVGATRRCVGSRPVWFGGSHACVSNFQDDY